MLLLKVLNEKCSLLQSWGLNDKAGQHCFRGVIIQPYFQGLVTIVGPQFQHEHKTV